MPRHTRSQTKLLRETTTVPRAPVKSSHSTGANFMLVVITRNAKVGQCIYKVIDSNPVCTKEPTPLVSSKTSLMWLGSSQAESEWDAAKFTHLTFLTSAKLSAAQVTSITKGMFAKFTKMGVPAVKWHVVSL